jgi:hypothetical protein
LPKPLPTAVSLTTYAGESEDFMRTPLEELVEQITAGTLHVQIGKVFHLDQIAETHWCMEENKAGGRIVGSKLPSNEQGDQPFPSGLPFIRPQLNGRSYESRICRDQVLLSWGSNTGDISPRHAAFSRSFSHLSFL